MPDPLHVDLETRSRADLPVVGARRYAVDPSTQITTAVSFPVPGACPVYPHLGTSPIGQLFADLHEWQDLAHIALRRQRTGGSEPLPIFGLKSLLAPWRWHNLSLSARRPDQLCAP